MTQDPDNQREFGAALKDVLAAQNDSDNELKEARALRKRHEAQTKYQPGLLLFIVAAWAFIGYIWLARPAFIFDGPSAVALTPDQREARMRYAIYLQRGRVASFQAEHGRLPESLRDTGPVESGVEYERTSDTRYDVFGSVDGTVLRLSDRMAADSFLGDAIRRLPPPIQ